MPKAPDDPVFTLATALSRSRPYGSGPTAGVITLIATHDVKLALLACLLGPAAIAGGRVLAKWIELLEPRTGDGD